MPSDAPAPEAGHSTAALIAQAFETLDALRRAGRLADAQRLGQQVVGEFPELAEAWNRLGVVQAEAGQGLQAVASLERAIDLAPRDPSHRANLAEVLRRAGLAARALAHGQAAVEIDPEHVASRVNLAYALLDCQRPAEALPHFERACEREPRHPQAVFGRGRALAALRRLPEAAEVLEHCTTLAPEDPELRLALSNVRRMLGQLEAARAEADRAAVVWPTHPAVTLARADVLIEQGRDAAAEAVLREGLRATPQVPGLAYRLALTVLAQGRYPEGFALYESRLQLGPGDVSNPIRQPLQRRPFWQGEPLQGKGLLVLTEQGFGDHIQFCRFVPRLAAAGAEVILGVPPPLEDLMRGLAGTAVLTHLDEIRSQAFDYWTFVGSLPHRLGVDAASVGSPAPYLGAELARRQAWWQRLARRPGRARIGLVWGGRPDADYERRRSVPFAELARLGEVADVAWYALQSGDRAADTLAHRDRIEVEVFTPAELGTFADTAALLAELDLLITVDTAFCHLAGAIGAPAWLLLPTAPDWRWALQPDRSPWYPSVRIFRQGAPGDWAGVIGQVGQALRQALDRPAGPARFAAP
ncbi:MAG: tetratricopeptide repeat protein [Rubrivivax sp.]